MIFIWIRPTTTTTTTKTQLLQLQQQLLLQLQLTENDSQMVQRINESVEKTKRYVINYIVIVSSIFVFNQPLQHLVLVHQVTWEDSKEWRKKGEEKEEEEEEEEEEERNKM